MANPGGLLFVFSEPGQNVSTKEFNDWYDKEHGPVVAKSKGFLTGARYEALDGEAPTYLALYELDSLNVLIKTSPEWTALMENITPADWDIVTRSQSIQQRGYSLISSRGDPPKDGAAPWILVVEAEFNLPTPEAKQEIEDFYEKEHITMHTKIPGFIRARRWKLDSWEEITNGDKEKGPSMTWITAYEIGIDPNVYVASKEHQETISTKWMKETTEKYVVQKRPRQYKLLKNFLLD